MDQATHLRTTDRAKHFIDALGEAEERGELGGLIDLFSDDAELRSAQRDEVEQGRQGAGRFWRAYLAVFERIASTFTSVIETDEQTVLEWESEGSLSNGAPVRYRGVSVLEWSQNRIVRFRTYYDSAVFMPLGAKRPG